MHVFPVFPSCAAEIGDQGFVQKCMLDEGQIVLDSAAAEQYFLIEVSFPVSFPDSFLSYASLADSISQPGILHSYRD